MNEIKVGDRTYRVGSKETPILDTTAWKGKQYVFKSEGIFVISNGFIEMVMRNAKDAKVCKFVSATDKYMYWHIDRRRFCYEEHDGGGMVTEILA
jgi:hypothetical protein